MLGSLLPNTKLIAPAGMKHCKRAREYVKWSVDFNKLENTLSSAVNAMRIIIQNAVLV